MKIVALVVCRQQTFLFASIACSIRKTQQEIRAMHKHEIIRQHAVSA